ncbi:interferon alpha/beta receptor 1b-like [Symphorus nematophorus]
MSAAGGLLFFSSFSSVAVFFFFFSSCCFRLGAVGAAELPAPRNVDMLTLNTNYALVWDWGAAESHAVTFTTEYIGRHKLNYKRSPNWYMACNQTTSRSCDLTKFNLHFLGIHVIRVRANLNGSHSSWVQLEFCPDKDTNLGPPSKVRLSPAGNVLDVFISDPLTSTNTSMKEKQPGMYYSIVYWEGSADTQASSVQTLDSSSNLVTLPHLRPWTGYCVSVQSRYDFYNKSSSFTSPQCMQTEGPTQWWVVFLCFLASLVICFLLVLLGMFGFFRVYKSVKDLFYPTNQLPTHFKEYLCDSPGSDIPHLFTPDSESELLCDKVTICPEPVLEIHNPPHEVLQAPPAGLEPDSSGRHSRQDSSGSGDSGIYSTGGAGGSGGSDGSGGSGQTLAASGAEASSSSSSSSSSWQGSGPGPVDPERVRMLDMTPALKTRPAMADEGVVDMFV